MNTKVLEIEDIVEILPYGSGINGDWHITTEQGINSLKIKANNTFSAMDEMGGYCHDYEFDVTFSMDSSGLYYDVSVNVLDEFNCGCGFGLEEYLTDTISSNLGSY